jgi:hypothetical protein
MSSNRRILANYLKWARYQERCDKIRRYVGPVGSTGYRRVYLVWYYQVHKRKMQGLGSKKAQRREHL